MNQPLTPEQIWGVPEEQQPEPEQKDYFDLGDQNQPEMINGLARKLATMVIEAKQQLDGEVVKAKVNDMVKIAEKILNEGRKYDDSKFTTSESTGHRAESG